MYLCLLVDYCTFFPQMRQTGRGITSALHAPKEGGQRSGMLCGPSVDWVSMP